MTAPDLADRRRRRSAHRAAVDAYIARTVAAAPPLTRAQADELAVLFRRPADREQAAA